jgi:hypothetical protein
MDQEADEQERRDPGQIDDGNGTCSGQKGADLIEVADRLRRFAPLWKCNREADHRAMNGQGKTLIEHRRRPHDHARTNQIERSLERVSTD